MDGLGRRWLGGGGLVRGSTPTVNVVSTHNRPPSGRAATGPPPRTHRCRAGTKPAATAEHRPASSFGEDPSHRHLRAARRLQPRSSRIRRAVDVDGLIPEGTPVALRLRTRRPAASWCDSAAPRPGATSGALQGSAGGWRPRRQRPWSGVATARYPAEPRPPLTRRWSAMVLLPPVRCWCRQISAGARANWATRPSLLRIRNADMSLRRQTWLSRTRLAMGAPTTGAVNAVSTPPVSARAGPAT